MSVPEYICIVEFILSYSRSVRVDLFLTCLVFLFFRVCSMPPRKRKAPGGAEQRRRVQVYRRAMRDARAAREARREEEQDTAQGRDMDIEMSQAGDIRDVQSQASTSRDPEPAVRPLTTEDLVAVITGVLQAQ